MSWKNILKSKWPQTIQGSGYGQSLTYDFIKEVLGGAYGIYSLSADEAEKVKRHGSSSNDASKRVPQEITLPFSIAIEGYVSNVSNYGHGT